MKKLVIAVFLAYGFSAFAQTAEVSGIVYDQSGACIPKARLALIEVRQLEVSQTTASNTCAFTFGDVEVGEYEIRVTGPIGGSRWFLPYRKEFKLHRGQHLSLKIVLKIDPHVKVVDNPA